MSTKRRTRSDWGTVRKTRNRFTAEYTGPDGSRHTPGVSFPTRLDARGWLADERRLIQLGTWTPPLERRQSEKKSGETVGQWLDRFHALMEQRNDAPQASTMQDYRKATRVRITDPVEPGAQDRDVCSLREVKLAELTRADVYRWWDGLQRCFPATATTNQKAYKRLKAACDEAVRRDMIPTNPVNIKDAGKRVRPEEKYLPEDWEIDAIIKEVRPRYRVLTSLIFHHGLRIGEALALERDDVAVEVVPAPRLPNVTVTIKQNAQRITDDEGTRMEVQPPKTRAGFRTVPIMPIDVPLFLEHLALYVPKTDTELRHSKGTRRARLLTATSNGGLVMDTSYRSILARAKRRAGVNAGINPHTGRNWLITRLAEKGAHLKEIGNLLGQEDMKTILDVYMKVRAGRTTSLMESVSKSVGNR